MPKPINYKDFEVKWRHLEMVCLDETKKMKSEMDFKFSGQKFYNLDQAQEKGLSSLLSRRNNGELVYFSTDKSGRMSVDTLGNFSEKMLPHIADSVEVRFDDVDKIQNVNNAKSKCWMRILNAGARWGH